MPTETFLTKQQASAFLTNTLGLPVAVKTLSKLISTGGGPTYRKFQNRCVYLPSDLRKWAESRLSAPKTNSCQ